MPRHGPPRPGPPAGNAASDVLSTPQWEELMGRIQALPFPPADEAELLGDPRPDPLALAARSAMASFGGIDLGGTKIEAAVFDEDGTCSVPPGARPDHGRPADVADEMEATLAHAARAGDTEPPGSTGRCRLAGHRRGRQRLQRPQPAGLGRIVRLGPELERPLGCPVTLGNDVRVGTGRSSGSEPTPYRSLLGVFWGTGVGGGVILDGRPWVGRGAGGEVGHVVVEMDGAQMHLRAPRLHGGLLRPGGDGRPRRHLHHDKGRPTDLFKIMREHGHTRLTSSVWGRALEHGDELAHHMIDRAVRALGAGVASVANVLDVEAIVIGGGLGVRLGSPT